MICKILRLGTCNEAMDCSAVKDGGGNRAYQYGAGGFPTDTYQARSYWVDVVLAE